MENFSGLLNDQKALELKPCLPKNLKGRDTRTQYTLLASAVRSTDMDRCIRDFMRQDLPFPGKNCYTGLQCSEQERSL